MMDPNSVADTSSWRTLHIHLDWLLDFEAKRLSGSATLLLQRLGRQDQLQLDATGLAIDSVLLDDEPVEFGYEATGSRFGGVLTITPPPLEHPVCSHKVKYH